MLLKTVLPFIKQIISAVDKLLVINRLNGYGQIFLSRRLNLIVITILAFIDLMLMI